MARRSTKPRGQRDAKSRASGGGGKLELSALPTEPRACLRELIPLFFSKYPKPITALPPTYKELLDLLKLYAVLRVVAPAAGYSGELLDISDIDASIDQCGIVGDAFESVRSWLDVQEAFHDTEAEWRVKLSGNLIATPKGDLARIQTIINDLRSALRSAVSIEERHRARLLRKLEQLQAELHKTVSDYDRCYGFLIDLFSVARTAGEDLKPLVDRAKELVEIVLRVQSVAHGLPPGGGTPPLLAAQTSNGTTSEQ